MAISLIQQKKGANTSTTALAIATTSNTLNGDTIIVGIIGNTNVDRISSISATGMTFTKVAAASGLIGGGGASYISIWVAENVTAATTPTITINKSATWAIQAVVDHWRGLDTTSLDKTARAGGTTVNANSGNTATLSQADELVIGIVGSDFGGATYTAGAGYTNLNQQAAAAGDIMIESKIVAATTAVNATATLSDVTDQAAAVLTFKAAAAGTTVTPANATLAISTFAPTVLTPRTVIPDPNALTITTYAPTVNVDEVLPGASWRKQSEPGSAWNASTSPEGSHWTHETATASGWRHSQ